MQKQLKSNDRTGMSALSRYEEIEQDMRARIASGQWPVNTLIPDRHSLAKEYNVARTTVERAIARLLADGTLNARRSFGTFVAPETKIAEIILPPASVAYVEPTPQMPASPFRRTKNLTVGLLILDERAGVDAATYQAWMSMLEQEIAGAGACILSLDVSSLDTPVEILSKSLDKFLDNQPDAVIAVAIHRDGPLPDFVRSRTSARQVPLICISHREVNAPVSQVIYDSRYAGNQAVQHLLRMGWNEIVFFSPYHFQWAKDRSSSAHSAILEAGLPEEMFRILPIEDDIPLHPDDPNVCRDLFLQSCRGAELFDLAENNHLGIVAANDLVAFEIMKAADMLGKKAGVDYGIVGFDDDPKSAALGLTSLARPIGGMIKEASRLLMRVIHADDTPVQTAIRSRLIPRASTYRIPV